MKAKKAVLIGLCLGLTSRVSSKGDTPSFLDDSLRTVTKKVSLGNFVPKDLVTFRGIRVARRIVPDLTRLLLDARKAGLTLKVVSGYRSYEKQKQVVQTWITKERTKDPHLTREQAEKLVDTYSARPGHSEHQLGTTVDILSAENGYQFSADKKWSYVRWLEKNAHRYNFKISYPEGSTEYQYEPWHLRWYPPSKTISPRKTL